MAFVCVFGELRVCDRTTVSGVHAHPHTFYLSNLDTCYLNKERGLNVTRLGDRVLLVGRYARN